MRERSEWESGVVFGLILSEENLEIIQLNSLRSKIKSPKTTDMIKYPNMIIIPSLSDAVYVVTVAPNLVAVDTTGGYGDRNILVIIDEPYVIMNQG
jgi:hypothetical protein